MSREASSKSSKSKDRPSGASALTPGKLRSLYLAMLQCRMIAEKARMLGAQRRGQNGGVDPIIGEEAAVAASVSHLRGDDSLVPSPHDWSSSFLKGMPLQDVFIALGSRHDPALEPKPAPRNILRLAPDAPFNLRVGVALAYKMGKKPNLVLSFLRPEFALSEPWPGDLRAAFRFSAEWKLPIVCVIQGMSGELSEQPGAWARECGIPVIPVDGKDAVAVFRVAEETIRRAREGHGPAVIECVAWNAGPPGMRPVQEQDPLVGMENYLKQRKLWSDAWKRSRVGAFQHEIERAARSTQAPARKKK